MSPTLAEELARLLHDSMGRRVSSEPQEPCAPCHEVASWMLADSRFLRLAARVVLEKGRDPAENYAEVTGHAIEEYLRAVAEGGTP